MNVTLETPGIVAIGETEKRRPETPEEARSLETLQAEAARSALDDAGVEIGDVDGLGIVRPGVPTPGNYVGQLAETLGFENLGWTVTVDEGGASAISLVLQAGLAIEAGVVEAVLCLGADLPVDPRSDAPGLFDRDPRGYVRNYLDPFGTQGPNSRLAHVQTVHMDEYGTTRRQLGQVAVTQRRHALANPLAYFDEAIDIEAYLDAPSIAGPISLFDCVIPVNAGYAVLLVSADMAADLETDSVTVGGFAQRTNYRPETESAGDAPPDATTTGVDRAGAVAFDRAGIEPATIDCWQLYDDYPIVVAMQIEDLGICPKGEGGRFLAETDLSIDGAFPLNTGGGQLSAGQTGMAAGFVQLLEGIRQLQGDGGDRQVPDAERCLVTGVGGVAYGTNLRHSSVLILERGPQRGDEP